jgi:hypothetical protein
MGILPMSTFRDVDHGRDARATRGTVFRPAFVDLPDLPPIGNHAAAAFNLVRTLLPVLQNNLVVPPTGKGSPLWILSDRVRIFPANVSSASPRKSEREI